MREAARVEDHMRTVAFLLCVVAAGCGSRSPTWTGDGGPDAPVGDASPLGDGARPDGVVPDGGNHDGAAATLCELAGGTCVSMSPGACRGTVVGMSCGPNQRQCCMQDDGGTFLTPCELAGGACVALYPGSCTGGTVTGLSCGSGLGLECCMPGDGGVRACTPSGGCPSGPRCGASCCKVGEWCDPSTGTCRCSSGSSCTGGDTCSGGPVSIDGCGMVCCGVSGPCPQ